MKSFGLIEGGSSAILLAYVQKIRSVKTLEATMEPWMGKLIVVFVSGIVGIILCARVAGYFYNQRRWEKLGEGLGFLGLLLIAAAAFTLIDVVWWFITNRTLLPF